MVYDLSISTICGKWYVQRKHAEQLNLAYQDGQKIPYFPLEEEKQLENDNKIEPKQQEPKIVVII